jgi:hypothetical protein
MKITVAYARSFAAALTAGADEADKSGSPDFDLMGSVQALDDAARAELQAAIDSAAHQMRIEK